LTLDEIPAHTHGYLYKVTDYDAGTGGTAVWQQSTTQQTSSAGGGQPHDHTLTMQSQTNLPSYIQWIWLYYGGV